MSDFLDQYSRTHRFQLGLPSSFRFVFGTSSVLFLRSGPRSFVGDLYTLDLATKQESVLLTATDILDGAKESLSEEEKARRERTRSAARGIASFDVSADGKLILVPLSGRLFVVDRESRNVRELIDKGGYPVDPVFSPSADKVACVRDGDLYVIDIASNQQVRLTSRKSEHITNGLAEFVAQEEMSRYHGFWWSPDGESIAYQQTDTSMLEVMTIMDPMSPSKAPRSWPYPRPGHDNAQVRLGLISASGGETRWIAWDSHAYPYLASVRWPKSAALTLVVQNRQQTEQAILEIDTEAGSSKPIHIERDEAWLNLDQSTPRWLPDGSGFFWSSERDGWFQLELRKPDGTLVTKVGPPEIGYKRIVDVDPKSRTVVVSCGPNPTETHMIRLSYGDPNRAPQPLTHGQGVHTGVFSGTHDRWIEVSHTLDGGRRARAMDDNGEEIVTIRSVAEAPARLPSLELLEVEKGARFHAAVVTPTDFDSSKSYPVLLFVYGGPGVRRVIASPFAFLLNQWFADHGFIVVTFDGRGTPGQGRAWERAIKGNFIDVPLQDQISALEALGAERPELDLQRVGVFGWSFGGYFSAMAVMKRPDVFKVGVAGAPVTDWLDYDTHYTERYLGLPEESAEAYENSSVLKFASTLNRPLLLIHGTSDDNVYFSHSMKLSDALFRAGKAHDFLPLAEFTHMVADPLVTTRLYTRIADYFVDHLKP